MGDPDFNASFTSRQPETATADYASVGSGYYALRNVRTGCGDLKEILLRPLPATRSEVEKIAAKWKESNREDIAVYFGSDATEDRFKAEAQGKRVIHLATHGYFLEGTCQPNVEIRGRRFSQGRSFIGENPLLLSGLFFAGANRHGEGADSAGTEDGILTAYEVSGMDLEGTDLVVLSACETSLGEVKEGEGIYGLRRAFQMAGARTVISALWPVSDKAMAEIMSRLYDSEGESLPRIMRRIQLARLRELRAANEVDHPYSWGAIMALGDWR
jgi:CHAT domain-containing protein